MIINVRQELDSLNELSIDAKIDKLVQIASILEKIVIKDNCIENTKLAIEVLDAIHNFRFEISHNKSTDLISGKYDKKLKEAWINLNDRIK